MALSLDSLDLLPPTGGEGGTPLRIPLDTIDEDPDQPRQEFDEQSLDELAETIRERRRAPAGLGARTPHPARALDAQLRRPSPSGLQAGRTVRDTPPLWTRPPTAWTSSSKTSSARA